MHLVFVKHQTAVELFYFIEKIFFNLTWILKQIHIISNYDLSILMVHRF